MSIFVVVVLGALIYLFSRVRRLEREVRQLNDRVTGPSVSREDESTWVEDEPAGAASGQQTERPTPQWQALSERAEAFETSTSSDSTSPSAVDDAAQATADAAARNAEARESRDDPWQSTKPDKPGASGQPSFIDSAIGRVKRYFTEGNLIVRVGIIVLFFGVAFLLQYANEQGVLQVPIEFKMFAVAQLGLVLLAVGWYLRKKRGTYALIMQGGGLGILYISVFAALRLFQLLPAGGSLVLLVMMVVLSAALAVVQNAPSLAVMAVTGGFLAPVLTSNGDGSHIALFSYYAVLNGGILAVAWFKSWRLLNLLGFGFTFVIGTLWGVLEYQPPYMPSVQAFLVLFFLFYVLIAMLYARRQPPRLKGYVDGTLVFGLPMITFGLQAGLVYEFEYGLAWSALVLAGFYAALVLLCRRFGGEAYRLLSEAYLALAVIFGSLTVPLALDGEWIATAWALEGAALVWICVRQQRQLGILFAIALQFGAGFLFLPDVLDRQADWVLLNSVFIGGLMVALGGMFSSYYLRYYQGDWVVPRESLTLPLLLWGLCWWFGNGLIEILIYIDTDWQWLTIMAFMALSALALGGLEFKLDWRALRFTPLGLLAAMGLMAAANIDFMSHPLAEFGWIGWPLLVLAYAGLLALRDRLTPLAHPLLPALHAAGWWLVAVLLSLEWIWRVRGWTEAGESWVGIAEVMVTVGMLWIAFKAPVWPWRAHRVTYAIWAALPMTAFLVLWTLVVGLAGNGRFNALPHLPFLNPLDLTQVLVLFTLLTSWRHFCAGSGFPVTQRQGWTLVGGLAFLWLNAVLLRALHHWTGLDYSMDAILGSSLAQAAVSVFWTVLGLTAMVVAAHKAWRPVWIGAAVLLGVVVAKLFFVDMGDSETLEVIVSFIAVGLLLLVVGYVSPMPPKQELAAGDR